MSDLIERSFASSEFGHPIQVNGSTPELLRQISQGHATSVAGEIKAFEEQGGELLGTLAEYLFRTLGPVWKTAGLTD